MFNRLLPLSVLPSKIYRRFALDILGKKFIIKKIYGNPMILPIDVGGIGNILSIFGQRELDQREILASVIHNGTTILDIGANIGYYAIMEFALVGASGKIYAYEPDSRNVDILRRNVSLNNASGVIDVHEEAVSNANGFAEFHIAEYSNLSSMHVTRGYSSEALAARGMNNRKYIKKIKVRQNNLWDILVKSERPIDLIRMDIEGHEIEVLDSLLHGLEKGIFSERAPKYIVFEPHSWEYGSYPNKMTEILNRLSLHGFGIDLLGTRDETRSPISALGYEPFKVVPEKIGINRGIYKNIEQAEAIRLVSSIDGVTTVLLKRA